MELTINIKEQSKIDSFLNLIKEYDYIEIISMNDKHTEIPSEHKRLLKERLKRIEEGKTSFKSWDLVKKKYEGKF
jgi:hypothetical protein